MEFDMGGLDLVVVVMVWGGATIGRCPKECLEGVSRVKETLG